MQLQVIHKTLGIQGSETPVRFFKERHGGQFTCDQQVMDLVKFIGAELARVQQRHAFDHERGHLLGRQTAQLRLPVRRGGRVVDRGPLRCGLDVGHSRLPGAGVDVLVRVLDQVNNA